MTGGFDWYGGGGQQTRRDRAGQKVVQSGREGARPDRDRRAGCVPLGDAEGRTVNGSQLVRAKGGSATVEIPIVSDYAPNFFLTAVFLKDQQYYAGTKSVKVPPVEQQLSVELKASKPQYQAGRQRRLTRWTRRTRRARPVAAEFSLGVVDEAIYAIRKEAVQEILEFFYGKKWNRVSTPTRR